MNKEKIISNHCSEKRKNKEEEISEQKIQK